MDRGPEKRIASSCEKITITYTGNNTLRGSLSARGRDSTYKCQWGRGGGRGETEVVSCLVSLKVAFMAS